MSTSKIPSWAKTGARLLASFAVGAISVGTAIWAGGKTAGAREATVEQRLKQHDESIAAIREDQKRLDLSIGELAKAVHQHSRDHQQMLELLLSRQASKQ